MTNSLGVRRDEYYSPAPEQYPDSYIAEQGAGMGQIANPHLRDGVILPHGSSDTTRLD